MGSEEKMRIFSYWESDNNTFFKIHPYILMCREALERHCGEDFDLVFLDGIDSLYDYMTEQEVETYKRISVQLSTKSDFIMAKILDRHRGIFIDADVIALRSWKGLVEKAKEHGCNFMAIESHTFYTGFMWVDETSEVPYRWSMAQDWLLRKNDRGGKSIPVPKGSLGPALLSKVVNKEIGNREKPRWGISVKEDYVDGSYYCLAAKKWAPFSWTHWNTGFLSEKHSLRRFDGVDFITLWNSSIPGPFKLMSREEILSSGNSLVARLFRKALLDEEE